MAELMHFQPGKTFYDAYQGARSNTLAQMAFNSQGEERQSALGKLAGLNPDAAFKLKADFDDQDRADLAEFTNVFMTLPDDLKQPAYSKGVQRFGHKFRAMGIEPPADFKQAMPLFEQIAAASGGKNDGDTRWIQTVDENGKPVWAAANNRGIKPTKFGLPTSYKLEADEATGKQWRFNTKTGQLEPVDDEYAAPQPQPTIQGADNFKQAFTGLASRHGAQITSITRTPEENRRVGGVANSYHLSSQAGDFVVPQQNKAQFMSDARAMGLEAIDEGDHIHVEPPSRGAPPPRPASGYVGLSAAEKARVQAEEKAKVDLAYAGPTAAATAEGKARVEAQYGPRIAGDTTAAQEEARNRVAIGAKSDARVRDANDILSVLDEVEKILPQATGGIGGYAVDRALGGAGYATKGSQAGAQLEVLSSELIRRVPRFEGPQSDADRQAYMVAAGDVANPMKPVAVRMAAVKTMRKLQEKYAAGGGRNAQNNDDALINKYLD